MEIAKECLQCGGRFRAKANTAKFCSARCRQRNYESKNKPQLPDRREGAALVALPKTAAAPSADGLLATTRAALESADRLATPAGQAALLLATVLESGVQDTGSSIAALVRQHLATLDKALEGANRAQDPLDQILAKRRTRSA